MKRGILILITALLAAWSIHCFQEKSKNYLEVSKKNIATEIKKQPLSENEIQEKERAHTETTKALKEKRRIESQPDLYAIGFFVTVAWILLIIYNWLRNPEEIT